MELAAPTIQLKPNCTFSPIVILPPFCDIMLPPKNRKPSPMTISWGGG